jgi:SAM-dependent methyltransferase
VSASLDAPLSQLRRLIQASPGRRTRLHTMRGELLPLSAAAELPRLVLARLRHGTPDGPWFCTPAVAFVERIVQPHWRVLECGAGRSTLWFARRAASVLALEDSTDWHAQVARLLAGHTNATLEQIPAREFPARMSREPNESYDLVVVDGSEHDEHGGRLPAQDGRVACVLAAIPLLRPGGVLILDNSDWPHYRLVDEPLAGWHSTRLRGFPNAPMTPTETTFYWKPPSRATR